MMITVFFPSSESGRIRAVIEQRLEYREEASVKGNSIESAGGTRIKGFKPAGRMRTRVDRMDGGEQTRGRAPPLRGLLKTSCKTRFSQQASRESRSSEEIPPRFFATTTILQ